VAREDSGTVAAEHGGGTILRRAQGITKEVSDGTKEGEKGVAAERVGKGRAVDSGLTLGKGKQDRPSGRVRQSGAGEASDGEEGGEVAARASEEGVANDVRRAKNVDIVGLRNDDAAAAKQALNEGDRGEDTCRRRNAERPEGSPDEHRSATG
jgi:hypothetical protein